MTGDDLTPAQLARVRRDAKPYLLNAFWRGVAIGAGAGLLLAWGVWSLLVRIDGVVCR